MQYVGIQSLLCDDLITDILEWMVYTLTVSAWQAEDGSADEVGLADHDYRYFSAVWRTPILCAGAAVLYGCYVDYENRGTNDDIDRDGANQLPWLRLYDGVPTILHNPTTVAILEWMIETLELDGNVEAFLLDMLHLLHVSDVERNDARALGCGR